MNAQRGSIALFSAVIVLPMMFLMMFLCIDLSRYYVEHGDIQQILDEAALHAYRFLPSEADAEKAARSYVRNSAYPAGEIIARARQGSVELVYRGTSRLSFSGLLGDRIGLPIDVRSEARGGSIHGVVAIDTSKYLAPQFEREVWGDPSEWPALGRFADGAAAGSAPARYLTQFCFNPYLSAVKQVAYGMFEYMSTAPQNSVGVLAFPGTLGEVDILRSAMSSGRVTAEVSAQYFLNANGPHSSNLHCAAAFEDEPGIHRYLEPLGDGFIVPGPKPIEERISLPGTYLLRDEGLHRYPTASLLWHRAVRESLPDVGALLKAVAAQWRSSGLIEPIPDDKAPAHAVNLALVIAGDLPRIGSKRFPDDVVRSELRARLQEIATAARERSDGPVRLIWMVLPSPQQPVGTVDVARLQAFFDVETLPGVEGRVLEARAVLFGDPESSLRSAQTIVAAILPPAVIQR